MFPQYSLILLGSRFERSSRQREPRRTPHTTPRAPHITHHTPHTTPHTSQHTIHLNTTYHTPLITHHISHTTQAPHTTYHTPVITHHTPHRPDVSHRGGNLSQPEPSCQRMLDGMVRLGCSADVAQRGAGPPQPGRGQTSPIGVET